jgi:hypothetical protein
MLTWSYVRTKKETYLKERAKQGAKTRGNENLTIELLVIGIDQHDEAELGKKQNPKYCNLPYCRTLASKGRFLAANQNPLNEAQCNNLLALVARP